MAICPNDALSSSVPLLLFVLVLADCMSYFCMLPIPQRAWFEGTGSPLLQGD